MREAAMIERAMVEEHLQLAEKHVAQGDQHLADQRELIFQMERDGHDTTEARRLLRQFEELQELHIADRDRLRQEKASLDENSN